MYNSENGRGHSILVKTFEGTSQNEISAEYNLPDYLPDINRLLKVSAKICETSHFLSGDTLEYDGRLKCFLLYATGDGNLKSAEFERDFSGNTSVSGTSGDCDIRFCADIETVSCRLQNPRKLTAKIKLALTSAVYCGIATTPNVIGKLTADEERALQAKTHAIAGVFPKKAEELSTPISEDLELDAALPSIEEIVAVELEPYMLELRTSDEKVNYKGEILAEILYRAAQTESDSENQSDAPSHAYFTAKIPISGEIAAEGVGDHPVANATIKIGSLEYRPQENTFGENRTAELDFDYSVYIDFYCNEETEITTDMYSTEYESICEQESISYETAVIAKSFNFSADGTASRDDTDFDKIVMTTATADIERTEKQGNKILFFGNANVSVILTNGAGIYLSRNFTVPLRAETDIKISEAFEIKTAATVLASSAKLDGDNIQTNLEILVSYTIFEKHTDPRIRQISVYKDRPARNEKSPSLTLCYPSSDDSLWDVAKKYSTTVPELMATNNLSAESTPAVLVIPRRVSKGNQRIL